MKNRRLGSTFPVLFLGLCLGLAGCGSGSSGNNPPISFGTVTIAAPTSGATIATLPMPITLNLLNGATLANIRVTLDGADITSKFAAAAGGTTTAQVSAQRVYVGNNRIAVVVGTGVGVQTVKAQFTYDPSTAAGSYGAASGDSGAPEGPGSIAADLADVIPIQTRVRMTNQKGQQVWGVQIGQNAYPDPNGNTDGFQVLAFKRSDLTLVYNNSFQTTDDTGEQNFAAAISPGFNASACGVGGCLEIVQSLDTIGDNPCQGGDFNTCVSYATNFQAIGGTDFWEPGFDGPAGVGYSLIGNVGSAGLHAGSSFQRLTCAVGGCLATVIPPQNQAFLNGIVPNGADGTLPDLNGSGSTGTTDIPATANMPELTVSKNGAMTGELILDNTNKYTFAYANPPVHFQMGVAPDDSSRRVVIIDGFGSTPQQVFESNPLPPNPDGSPAGGFFLVVLNATTLQPADVETITVNAAACPTAPGVNYCLVNGKQVWHLDSLSYEITQQYNSRNYLFFLTSIGNLNHNFTLTDADSGQKYNEQDLWDRVGQSIQDIGGTYSTFVSLNNQAFASDPYDQYTPNTIPQDDYALVGQWWLTNNGAAPNPYAMEVSSQISRQTTTYPVPSNVQGALEVENDGYYRVMLHTKYAGLMPKMAFTLTSAPLVPPVPWPLTGVNDSDGLKAAYAWTSQQLLSCITGCTDIRAAYTNLDQSPAIWLTLLSNLELPEDCDGSIENPDCPLNFDEDDFETVKSQLSTEIQYLGVLREYENNIVGLLTAEQANVSVILQQTTDEVLGNVRYTDASISYGISSWRQDVEDGLGIVGDAEGFAGMIPVVGTAVAATAQTEIGITDFALDASAKHTNNPNGASLIEQAHELTVASGLAQKTADQYARTLTTVGADFSRIAKDWGRLRMVGVPIVNNDMTWSPDASGILLQSFDTAIRRSFYKSLLASGYWIVHYRYAAPGIYPSSSGYNNILWPDSSGCHYHDDLPWLQGNNPDSYAYIPGALIDGPGASVGGYTIPDSLNTGNLFPTDLWWDVWALQQNTQDAGCATGSDGSALPSKQFFDTTGLFRPLGPGGDPTALGFYKPWFYQRGGIPVKQQTGTSTSFWYQSSPSGGPPYLSGQSDWAPDPDNY